MMSNIKGDLEESDLPIPFDIVDFHTLPKSMQENILKDGVIWKK
jgi:hypothetical protein